MKTVILAVLLVFILMVCGCGVPTDIEYHYNTSPTELTIRAGYPVLGYAHRDWKGTKWGCNLWIAPIEVFPSQNCWHAVLEHEKRHCYEGDFHPDTPEESSVFCQADEGQGDPTKYFEK